MNETQQNVWHRERQAAILFVGSAVATAVAVGAMMIADWSGGRLDNRIEPLFWAGAILGAAGIALFGAAAASNGRLLRLGMALFLTGPVLCAIAVFGDYWI